MFRSVRALKKKGVLAINKRNADYTLKYNPRRLYPLVDDKLRTKQLALANNIAVPDLYAGHRGGRTGPRITRNAKGIFRFRN